MGHRRARRRYTLQWAPPPPPPPWGVKFCEHHVELAGAGGAGAGRPAPTSAASPTPAEGGGAAASTNTNYALGRAAMPELDAIAAWISAPSTTPADALALREGVAALYADGHRRLLAAAAAHAPGGHNGTAVVTDMRQHRPGPGSSSRTPGPHN